MDNVERRRDFIINFVYWSLIIGVGIVVLKFTDKYLMPFVVGFIISFLLKPIINRLLSKFGEKKWVSLLVILTFYTVFAFMLFWLFVAVFSGAQNFAKTLPSLYKQNLYPFLQDVISWGGGLIDGVNPNVLEVINEMTGSILDSLEGVVKTLSGGAVNFLTKIVSSVPNILISILIAVISSFFFTMDYQEIVKKSMGIIPKKQRDLILDVKDGLINVLGKYLKAYAFIMTVTFLELALGLFVLRVSNPVGVAAMIAAVDILPVLGTGGVVIPWMAFEAINGNFTFALGLLVLYLVITIIRNIIEPKILGDQIGLHPLLTLISIYVGLKVMGFWGLFAFPIGITIIKSLHDDGKIDIFRKMQHKSVDKA